MKNLSREILSLVSLVICEAQASLTYYLDRSCTNRVDPLHAREAIADAVGWAGSGAQRMQNPADTLQESYFRLLFVHPSDRNYNLIKPLVEGEQTFFTSRNFCLTG